MKRAIVIFAALASCVAPEKAPSVAERREPPESRSMQIAGEPPPDAPPGDPCAPGGQIERLAGQMAQRDMKVKGPAAAEVRRLAANHLLPDCAARRKELRSKVFAGFTGGNKETLLAATELVVVIEAAELFTAVAYAITNHAAAYKDEMIAVSRKMRTERWVAGVKRMLPDERRDMRLGALMMLEGEIHDAATGWVKKLTEDPDERIQRLARQYMEGAEEVAKRPPVRLEDLPTIGVGSKAMPAWHIELQEALTAYRKLKERAEANTYAALRWESAVAGIEGDVELQREMVELAFAQPEKVRRAGDALLAEMKQLADAIHKTVAGLDAGQQRLLHETKIDPGWVIKDRIALVAAARGS